MRQPQLQFRVDPQLLVRVDIAAAERGQTRSALIRDAVVELLQEHEMPQWKRNARAAVVAEVGLPCTGGTDLDDALFLHSEDPPIRESDNPWARYSEPA